MAKSRFRIGDEVLVHYEQNWAKATVTSVSGELNASKPLITLDIPWGNGGTKEIKLREDGRKLKFPSELEEYKQSLSARARRNRNAKMQARGNLIDEFRDKLAKEIWDAFTLPNDLSEEDLRAILERAYPAPYSLEI